MSLGEKGVVLNNNTSIYLLLGLRLPAENASTSKLILGAIKYKKKLSKSVRVEWDNVCESAMLA